MTRTMLAALVLCLGSATTQAEQKPQEKVPADKMLAVADAVADSLVRVEYTLKMDKGEAPAAAGWSYRCPHCSNWHAFDAGGVIGEERPFEVGGLLLTPTLVVTSDPLMHPRFVESIAVRFGEQVVEAKPAGVARSQNAIFLELAEPLAGAKPLAFDAEKEGPYLAVTHARAGGLWSTNVQPMGSELTVRETGRRFAPGVSGSLIVAADGTPVGVCMREDLPLDDSWKGSPADWPRVSADEMKGLIERLDEVSRRGIVRVDLSFRSPRQQPEANPYRYARHHRQEDNATERNVLGVLMDERTVLVLAKLDPRVTGRLERIMVHPAEGAAVAASFGGTLKDYGALVVRLDKPLDGALAMSDAVLADLPVEMVLAADVNLQGENRVAYLSHSRISGLEIGWRRNLYPDLRRGNDLFLFDDEARLVAIPMSRREPVSQREPYRHDRLLATPVGQVQPVLASLEQHVDTFNVPLTADEENRLAWLGVELQAMDRELARVNKVSHLTGDGETGAIVSHVYPDSPAGRAGVQVGTILVRIHAEGEPAPLDVKIEEPMQGMDFPWDRLDEIPEQYFDRIPTPWPSTENTFTRALTDLGFGRTFTADFYEDGELVTRDFAVEQAPAHYDAAARHKSEPMGLSVRDMTYELRRYFQKAADDPGVVVSKVEPGSKASIAGIRPYELIISVNDTPVRDVKQFEQLIGSGGDLRLLVNRMMSGRVVKIQLPAPEVQTATATQPAASQGVAGH